MTETKQFLTALNEEVKAHPAVHHPFLEMVATRRFSKRAWLAFAQQLYPHVHFFIPYMEEMLLNTFDMNAKLIVAKILLDEYGEDAGGKSHPELFRRFLRACDGAEADAALFATTLDQATIDLVETHMRLCRDEAFLVGMGAIGQAHEFAIALLFPPLVKGMRLAGFTAEEIEFFTLHVEHDVEHSHMLEESMTRLAIHDRDREDIRRGAMASLACRADLWAAMQRRMIAVEEGQPSPTTDRTLLDLTRGYKHVSQTYWPA
ncbi:iron-containing redox enzyme family protein [soil metagenome]